MRRGIATLYLSFTSFHCTNKANIRAICGAGIAGVEAALAGLAASGAGAYVACTEGKRRKETVFLIEQSLISYVKEARIIDTSQIIDLLYNTNIVGFMKLFVLFVFSRKLKRRSTRFVGSSNLLQKQNRTKAPTSRWNASSSSDPSSKIVNQDLIVAAQEPFLWQLALALRVVQWNLKLIDRAHLGAPGSPAYLWKSLPSSCR